MIDITGVDLKKFVSKVYELSSPQGFGFRQPYLAELSDKDVEEILNFKGLRTVRSDMDYINGRACKMTVWEKEGKLEIEDSWYDHTNQQLEALLDSFGIKIDRLGKHSIACNCATCRQKRQEEKK